MALSTCLSFVSRTAGYLRRSRHPYASIPQLQKAWSLETLERFKIDVDFKGTVSDDRPLIFIGNHISYLDIPVLMSVIDDVSFVAKKELSAWPVIGRAASAMHTIFVERGCQNSRAAAREAIREGLRQNRRIVIFPSGTTCLSESKVWRQGVFEIALEMGVRVQPFRLTYSPLRQAAFIDQDLFPIHMYNLSKLKRVAATLEFHAPVTVQDPAHDCLHWQKWSQGLSQIEVHIEKAPGFRAAIKAFLR